MKNAASKWYNYVIALVGLGIIAAIAIIPYFAYSDSENWPLGYIKNVFLFAGVVVFFIGFVIQDIFRARARHATKNWADKLPKETTDKAWAIFFPFFSIGILSVIAGSVMTLIERAIA